MAVMKTFGTLYLIPSILGDSPLSRVMPPDNILVIERIRCFIVEEIRTSRRFLKKVCRDTDIDSITFLVYNEHSRGTDLSEFIKPLFNGEDVGLLSEAGTPCIADPGADIVSLAHEHHVRVIPLTGPSSIMLSLMASGFNGQNFAFHGYLPIDKAGRIKKIREMEKSVYSDDQTQIFIETPYRNDQLFKTITEICSDNTQLCMATDLTTRAEIIMTKNIRYWKGKVPAIHKRPTVFLLYK